MRRTYDRRSGLERILRFPQNGLEIGLLLGILGLESWDEPAPGSSGKSVCCQRPIAPYALAGGLSAEPLGTTSLCDESPDIVGVRGGAT